MRSMRHVKKSQKCRASKNRNAAKHRAHKREVASKRVWLGKTQFWERRSPIDEKFFAEVVVGGSAQTAKSSKPAEETKAQLKAKAKVLNQAPSGSQVKEVVKAPKKNQKKTNEVVEVITKKTTKQTESAVANGVPAKVQDKKKDVGEQLRVEINEKQSLDNDDMKSSVDSGVDVAHEHVSTKTPNGADHMAEMTGEIVDAVDEEPCVLKTEIRCGERCGCDRILDEHNHHDHDTSNKASDATEHPVTSDSIRAPHEKPSKSSKIQQKQQQLSQNMHEDSSATRFSENVAKFVGYAQKKLATADSEQVIETTIAPVTAAVTASPAPSPASSLAKRPRQYKLLPRDIEFCAYMLETYGDNYEGMASDSKNVYRDTANGIARKLRIFRESPQYDEYLQSKSA